MNYSELETLDASAYLIPDTFRNAYDTLACNVAKREARYQEGIADGNGYSAFFINYKSVWYASGKDGSQISSYEGIGYHATTADFYRGILDSGCPVFVQRSGVWSYIDVANSAAVPIPPDCNRLAWLAEYKAQGRLAV